MTKFYLEMDSTGSALANRVVDESHDLGADPVRLILPKKGAFFTASLTLTAKNAQGVVISLVKGVHYHPVELFHRLTHHLGKEVHAAIILIDAQLTGPAVLSYQAFGGEHSASPTELDATVTALGQAQSVPWGVLAHPDEFNPTSHLHDAQDVYGLDSVLDALRSVSAAVSIGDEVFHRRLIAVDLPAQEVKFFNTFNTAFNDNVDYVTRIADRSETGFILANQTIQASQTQCDDIDATNLQTELLVDQYDFKQTHMRKACALIRLNDELARQRDQVFDIPPRIEGLHFWADFTDAQSFKLESGQLVLVDKSSHARVFEDVTALEVPALERVINEHLGHTVARFTDRQMLVQRSGSSVDIDSNVTVIAILAKPNTQYLKSTLLSNLSWRITSDIANDALLTFTDGETTEFAAGSGLYDSYNAHVAMASITSGSGISVCLSNTPQSNYRGHGGFVSKPEITRLRTMYRIGDDVVPQNADIAEIMVYSRRLASYELDALSNYVYNKYGLEINLVVNGNFNDGLGEFESDYALSIDANAPGKIAILHKEAVSNQTGYFARFYVVPNFETIIRAMAEGNRFLAVNTANDTALAFWKQKHKLQAYARYELRLSVLYNPDNPPSIALMVNDVIQDLVVDLPTSKARVDDCIIAFTPSEDDVVLKLINKNVSGIINTFAVDSINLQRKIFS